MNKTSWQTRNAKEDIFEDKVRQLMYKRKITYQEASQLIKNGQRSVFDF